MIKWNLLSGMQVWCNNNISINAIHYIINIKATIYIIILGSVHKPLEKNSELQKTKIRWNSSCLIMKILENNLANLILTGKIF